MKFKNHHSRCAASDDRVQERGQAAVETMLAMLVLLFLIFGAVQLLFVSDAAVSSMVQAHFAATSGVHELDDRRKFTPSNKGIYQFSQDVELLPGLEWLADEFGTKDFPGKWKVKRRLKVFGGSYMGTGYSEFNYYVSNVDKKAAPPGWTKPGTIRPIDFENSQ